MVHLNVSRIEMEDEDWGMGKGIWKIRNEIWGMGNEI